MEEQKPWWESLEGFCNNYDKIVEGVTESRPITWSSSLVEKIVACQWHIDYCRIMDEMRVSFDKKEDYQVSEDDMNTELMQFYMKTGKLPISIPQWDSKRFKSKK